MLPMSPPMSSPRTMLRQLLAFFGRLGSSGASGAGVSGVAPLGSGPVAPFVLTRRPAATPEASAAALGRDIGHTE